MKIRPQERKWFAPQVSATEVNGSPIGVPLTGWEASFDQGVTWLPSRDTGIGVPGWLIAGPTFPGPGDSTDGIVADITLTATAWAYIRLRDVPETITADPIPIYLLTWGG